jgi:hypothetical protein
VKRGRKDTERERKGNTTKQRIMKSLRKEKETILSQKLQDLRCKSK